MAVSTWGLLEDQPPSWPRIVSRRSRCSSTRSSVSGGAGSMTGQPVVLYSPIFLHIFLNLPNKPYIFSSFIRLTGKTQRTSLRSYVYLASLQILGLYCDGQEFFVPLISECMLHVCFFCSSFSGLYLYTHTHLQTLQL